MGHTLTYHLIWTINQDCAGPVVKEGLQLWRAWSSIRAVSDQFWWWTVCNMAVLSAGIWVVWGSVIKCFSPPIVISQPGHLNICPRQRPRQFCTSPDLLLDFTTFICLGWCCINLISVCLQSKIHSRDVWASWFWKMKNWAWLHNCTLFRLNIPLGCLEWHILGSWQPEVPWLVLLQCAKPSAPLWAGSGPTSDKGEISEPAV